MRNEAVRDLGSAWRVSLAGLLIMATFAVGAHAGEPSVIGFSCFMDVTSVGGGTDTCFDNGRVNCFDACVIAPRDTTWTQLVTGHMTIAIRDADGEVVWDMDCRAPTPPVFLLGLDLTDQYSCNSLPAPVAVFGALGAAWSMVVTIDYDYCYIPVDAVFEGCRFGADVDIQ